MLELENFEKEYMIRVKGGKYNPSFTDKEKEVFDIEVCKYPTTQKMWIEVMDNNSSIFKDENKPVDSVAWWETLKFCNKLSEKYNLKPVYDLSQEEKGILKIIHLDGEIVEESETDFKNTEGFRLPTEAEWEWFARGGQVAIEQETFDYTYSGSNSINEVAWYDRNSGSKTQDVGLKKPNQLGLYDCSGNIWEWCYDTTENIENGKSYTCKAFDSSNIYRKLKGGSWYEDDNVCTVRCRNYAHAIDANDVVGFRLVRTI